MTDDNLLSIIIIIILLIFSAFFSACETAFTSINKIRLKSKADDGSKRAKSALSIIERYDKALTTILIGNNIVNIATSSIATILAIALVGETNGPLVSTVAVTLIVLIFGEIMPKTIARTHSETICLFFCDILRFLMIILTPLSAVFIILQKAVTKLFTKKSSEVSVTEQELMQIIDEIEDEGVLEEQESNLVRSALEFDETVVDQILVPRVNIVAVEINEDIDEVEKIFAREEYTRIPVYEKTIDHIVGVVNQMEFYRNVVSGKEFYLRDIMGDTMYIHNLMKISEVLKLMQKDKLHMAVVLDQYGGTQGIVTLEDILEELVGEIWDENDEICLPVKLTGKDSFEVDGTVSINDFNRFFEHRGIDYEIDTDSNTVGGWALELFGKLPEENETVTTYNFRITVLSMEERRIGHLRFDIVTPTEE